LFDKEAIHEKEIDGDGKERLLCIKKKKKGRDVVEMLFCNGEG
jgi:hypothetical protein